MVHKRIVFAVFLVIYLFSALALVPDIERQALLDLYNATNGRRWSNSSNWGIGDPCEGAWKFVACDPTNSNVVRLSAYKNRLYGTLPASLGNLRSLIFLDLGTNRLNGTIPDSVWNLKSLEYFDFRMTNLTGTIPDAIGDWENITEIELFYTKYHGTIPSAITKLNKLQILSLDFNNLSGTIPSGFEHLTQLQKLYLNDNSLSGTIPSAIGKLSKLTTLQLQNNFFTGPVPFTDANWFHINLNMSCNCFDAFPLWCYNSSCAPCAKGICNTTTAVVLTPQIIGHSVGINVALGVLAGICLSVAVASLLLLFVSIDRFGVHGSFYSALVNVGVIIGLLSALSVLPEPVDGYCVVFPWLFGIAFALVYGCLFIKTWALWKIWRLAKQFQKSDLTPLSIVYRTGICVAFEIIYLIVWTLVDPPVARTFKSADGSLRRHCTNDKYGYWFWIAFLAYKAVWMVIGLILTLLTKQIQRIETEAKEIALAIYNVFAVSVIAVPLAFALKSFPQALVVIQVGALLLAFTFTLLAIFFNVWFKIFGTQDSSFSSASTRSRSTTMTTSVSSLNE